MHYLEASALFKNAVACDDIEAIKIQNLISSVLFDDVLLAIKESIAQDNVELFRILFEACVENKDPITPVILLLQASKQEKIGIVKYLMKQVPQEEMEAKSVLEVACSDGCLESVKVLLTQLCPRRLNSLSLRMASDVEDPNIRHQMVELLLPLTDPTVLDHFVLKNCIVIGDNYLAYKVLNSIENYPIDRDLLRVACTCENQEMARYFYEKLPEDDIHYVFFSLKSWRANRGLKDLFFLDQWIEADAQKKILLSAIENHNSDQLVKMGSKRKM